MRQHKKLSSHKKEILQDSSSTVSLVQSHVILCNFINGVRVGLNQPAWVGDIQPLRVGDKKPVRVELKKPLPFIHKPLKLEYANTSA